MGSKEDFTKMTWHGIPKDCPKDNSCVEFESGRCKGVEVKKCPKRHPLNILLLGKRRVYGSDRSGRKGDWSEELFRDELARHHHVTHWGKDYSGLYDYRMPLPEVVDRMVTRPDIVLVTYDLPPAPGFNDLDIPKVLISSAFYPGLPGKGSVEKYRRWYEEHPFDLAFGSMPATVGLLKEHKVGRKGVFLSPYAVDTERFRKLAIEKEYDVATLFAAREDFYIRRRDIRKQVWDARDKISIFVNNAYWDDYIVTLNKTKININENSKSMFVNPRNLETMACGTLMLADWNEDYDTLGFKGGEHLVFYTTLEDMWEKIWYYLKHADEREAIAAQGMKFATENFYLTKKVNEFAEVVRRELLQ